MLRVIIFISVLLVFPTAFSQEKSLEKFLADSTMMHASISICAIDSDNGSIVSEMNSGKSLIPASVMKLVTSAAALELLGPDHTFKTTLGYTGQINSRSGKLTGDLIIKGGGDPTLGSDHFKDHYQDFIGRWISEIKKTGIKTIEGRVITDDSYYDYLPVPSKWLWEDAGNYYGAGAYGLSVFDNSYEIHFKTTNDSSKLEITEIVPKECRYEFTNWLVAAGTADEGYVFAAPYSTNGWLAGTIPANMNDFVLNASIADPPRLIAKMINERLEAEGINVTGEPSTVRLEQKDIADEIATISEIISPPLSEIIEVLNHESMNLYAEHLLKELGKKFKGKGSTYSGVEVVMDFLQNTGIGTDGMFIEDGSGLSPLNAINAKGLARLLNYMKTEGKYFTYYLNSLPEAGKEGTLKNYFRDPVFESRLKAKSGSMTRVRSYAGYLNTQSGKNLSFAIIINNYTGSSRYIISAVEGILKEMINE